MFIENVFFLSMPMILKNFTLRMDTDFNKLRNYFNPILLRFFGSRGIVFSTLSNRSKTILNSLFATGSLADKWRNKCFTTSGGGVFIGKYFSSFFQGPRF